MFCSVRAAKTNVFMTGQIDFIDTIFLHSDTLLLSLIAVDLDGAEGSTNVKYGKPNPAQEQCSAIDLDICPDLLLAAIAAAGAVGILGGTLSHIYLFYVRFVVIRIDIHDVYWPGLLHHSCWSVLWPPCRR